MKLIIGLSIAVTYRTTGREQIIRPLTTSLLYSYNAPCSTTYVYTSCSDMNKVDPSFQSLLVLPHPLRNIPHRSRCPLVLYLALIVRRRTDLSQVDQRSHHESRVKSTADSVDELQQPPIYGASLLRPATG